MQADALGCSGTVSIKDADRCSGLFWDSVYRGCKQMLWVFSGTMSIKDANKCPERRPCFAFRRPRFRFSDFRSALLTEVFCDIS
jgi:hypothetical protein